MKNRVLIDANILQYATNPDYSDDVYSLFRRMQVNGYILRVSSYTTFEVFRGLNKKRIPMMKKVIDAFEPIETDLQCFSIAAALDTCYRRYASTKIYADRFSDGDLVLAGSAFSHNAPILTANSNDFPRPFFTEAEATSVGASNQPLPIKTQLLHPDVNFFNRALKSYY